MIYSAVALSFSAALLAGCSTSGRASFSQDNANLISDKCGAPRGWITVRPGAEIQFMPPIDADYDVSICLLKALKDAGVTKIGFLGNEKIENESN